MNNAVVSPLADAGHANKTAPFQIALSAVVACLSLILMAAESIAEEGSRDQNDRLRIASELALDDGQAAELDRILAEVVDLRRQALQTPQGTSGE